MGLGHLDYETGKWVDDPAEVEEEHHGLDTVPVAPETSTAPAAPAVPLTIPEKARLIQLLRSGQANPSDISNARNRLTGAM